MVRQDHGGVPSQYDDAVATVAAAALLVWAIRTAPGLRSAVERELGEGHEPA